MSKIKFINRAFSYFFYIIELSLFTFCLGIALIESMFYIIIDDSLLGFSFEKIVLFWLIVIFLMLSNIKNGKVDFTSHYPKKQ